MDWNNCLVETGMDKHDWQDEKWLHWCHGVFEARERIYSEIVGTQKINIQVQVDTFIYSPKSGEVLESIEKEMQKMIGFIDIASKDHSKLMEVKTSAQASEQLFIEHLFTGQTQIYVHAYMKKHGLKYVPLIEYHYIKKSMIRIKKAESEEEFFRRIRLAGFECEIVKRVYQYTIEQLEDTAEYYYDLVVNNLSAKPCKNRNECWTYGRRCRFYEYCNKFPAGDELKKDKRLCPKEKL